MFQESVLDYLHAARIGRKAQSHRRRPSSATRHDASGGSVTTHDKHCLHRSLGRDDRGRIQCLLVEEQSTKERDWKESLDRFLGEAIWQEAMNAVLVTKMLVEAHAKNHFSAVGFDQSWPVMNAPPLLPTHPRHVHKDKIKVE